MTCWSPVSGNGGGVKETSSPPYRGGCEDGNKGGFNLLAAVASAYESTAASYASILRTFEELEPKIKIRRKRKIGVNGLRGIYAIEIQLTCCMNGLILKSVFC